MGIVKTSQKCKTALESDGLVLFLGVAHGVSHMDGHRVSLEAGFLARPWGKSTSVITLIKYLKAVSRIVRSVGL